MYLKCIEIVGFKSFADKTRIELKPGISGIVGPNGCGKSNVMDAIRWCIGEMSWKQLRSDSMVSVIFAGTERRPSVGLAEVTLTFDNAQDMLPVKTSEVAVTRRIFRSAESEYYLNRVQCRLKDIRELFFDTGIGNDGYAIIDQGGVDFIIKAKPEERRSVFEEAAGVSKYKAKREEALRKLERVEIDLGFLEERISLINEQIKKLDADARKAKLHQKYKTELTAMEASHILIQMGEIDSASAAEIARIAPSKQRFAELTTAIESEDGRLSALSLEHAGQQAAVTECGQKVSDHKVEVAQLDGRIRNAESGLEETRRRLAQSAEDARRDAETLARLEPEIEAALKALQEAEAAHSEARAARDAFDGELSRLEGEKESARKELDGCRARITTLAQACQESSRGLSSTDSRVGNFVYQVKGSLKELDKAGERLAAVRERAVQAREALAAQKAEVETRGAAAAALEASLAEARTASESFSGEVFRLRGEGATLNAQVEALEAQGGKDPYWVGSHAVVSAGLPGILGTVRSLIRVDERHSALVEDLLGERLYAVVCEDLAAAEAGIRFLKESGKGRARFLVSSSLPEGASRPLSLPPEAKLLMDVVQHDPAHARAVRFLLGEAYALGDGLYGAHWVSGGAAEHGASMKLADVEGLRLKARELESSSLDAFQRKTSKESEVSGLERQVLDAKAAVAEAGVQLRRAEADLEQHSAGVGQGEQEISLIEAEAGRILADIAQALEDRRRFHAELEGRRKEEEAARLLEGEAAGKVSALNEAVAAKRAERQHYDKTIETLGRQEGFARVNRDRFASQKTALEEGVQRRQAAEAEMNGRIESLGREAAESRERLEVVHRELAELEKQSVALHERLQATQNELQSLQDSLRVKRADSQVLQTEVQTSDLKVSDLNARRGMLSSRLSEEWQLTEAEAQEKYKGQPADPERMDFLRRRIADLGNVNMAAPEEYEELVKKHDGLQAQVDDLKNAKQDLHSAIAKINATTRENFRQTFTEVREHFRRLYGILFEGGEADLVLSDKENLLETGIEIVAQPPGKKLQTISQLSGGEKTLTAIALLFAFFMVRPSPFCMLDEADAALDEANIERFVSLLREFGDKTQFLVVSHNKKTMEACDIIYGVTMEESGVSALMSVDFRKKSDKEASHDGLRRVAPQASEAALPQESRAPEPVAAEAPAQAADGGTPAS